MNDSKPINDAWNDAPVELRDTLEGDQDAKAAFAKLAPSHQREYIRWVSEAKRAQTRLDRAGKCVEMIREKSAQGHER